MSEIFPEFEPLELAHRDIVEQALEGMECSIAEHTFSNLYLFRAAHSYSIARWEGLVLLIGKSYGGVDYALPPWGRGPVEEGARLLCRYLAGQGSEPGLFPVSEGEVAAHFSGEGWQAADDRDQADYLYSTEELAKLEGKKFQKRRNRLNKFMREHGARYSYRSFAAEHAEACAELARDWCDERCSLERPSTYRETAAAVEAALLGPRLGYSGGVALLDGEVAAFCLGEPLNDDTFVLHFEKARPGVDGLVQALGRDFCSAIVGSYAILNKEQDLGDPGLRQAKLGYHPVALAQKFRVSPFKQ